MHLKYFLCCSSLLVLLALPAMAAEPLTPRGEVSVKGGTDRSLLTTEFWAPLAQQSDRVLYGDIRLMGDNDENREGNLGLGYRQIKNDAVIGVHGWIDRRRTQHNSTFHQLTFGVERLGHIIDARANIYIPINNGRTIITPNIGVTSPYLAGSGIYYDTNGSINETPQYGLDGELGYRIPVFKKQIDAIRVYGGGYYFFRDNTVEVPGARFRTEAQVNKIFSVGARVQYDKPRGTQGFLEATLKFPFSAKRLYQESGIRSRLDESPERDVDIVTDAKIDTGLFKPVVNTATGTQQRILYVDNTKPDGGDGSYEKPFNTLKSAESALEAHDIVYVNRGDGTTRNMDQGIVIQKSNVQLIGSGSALTYGGYTLLNAGAAPVITNTQPFSAVASEIIGNGVTVLADNGLVSGLTISGANGYSIRIAARGADAVFQNATVTNNTIINGKNVGIIVHTQLNGQIDNTVISNNTVINSGALYAQANTGYMKNITVQGNTVTNGTGIAMFVQIVNARNDSTIISNNTITNNNGAGLLLVGLGTQKTVDIFNNTVTGNTGNGIEIQNRGGATGSIDTLNIYDNVTNANTIHGTAIGLGTGYSINTITLRNITANNNTQNGISVDVPGGIIDKMDISSVTTQNNGITGIALTTRTSGVVNNTTVTNATSRYNTQSGLFLNANVGAFNNVVLNNNTLSYNTTYGLRLDAVTATSTLNNVSVAGNTVIGNTLNGVIVTKSNAGATVNVDLGGGSQNSIGQNNISGNIGTDLRLNYTGGGAVFAKNNWWGNVAGLQPGRVTLSASTTVDSTAFLTADPRP